MQFLFKQVVEKLYTKLRFFLKKSTLANIGTLDNKKFVKFEKRKQIFFFPFGFIAQTFYV